MGCGASKHPKTRQKTPVQPLQVPELAADDAGGAGLPVKSVGAYILDVRNPEASVGIEDANAVVEDRPMVLLDNEITYTGQWKGTKKHGKGKQQYPDGAFYDGDWQDGLAHGFGIFRHADGTTYEGEWASGKANGQGVLTQPKGFVLKYEGQWKDDLRHGFGKEERKDGSVYEGNFENGKMHGRGLLKCGDGNSYDGFFVNDELNGWGMYRWPNRIYFGEWQDNYMHGFGVFRWGDGRKYEGQYNQGKKEGFGIFDWPDGRQYKGWWKNNKHHSYGQFRSAKGEVRHAVYNNSARTQWLEGDEIEKYKKENDIPGEPENPTMPDWLQECMKMPTPNEEVNETPAKEE